MRVIFAWKPPALADASLKPLASATQVVIGNVLPFSLFRPVQDKAPSDRRVTIKVPCTGLNDARSPEFRRNPDHSPTAQSLS